MLLLWGFSMHVPSLVQLKRAFVLMSSSFKALANQLLLQGIAWLTCIQSVGAWKIL